VPNTEVWVRVSLKEKNCWEIYNSFRMNIKRTNCFGALLEISEDLPESINRWFGENIRAVSLPIDLFVLNHKNKPVLIKAHHDLISKLIAFKINFIISSQNNEDVSEYRDYLCYIFSKQPKVFNIFAFGIVNFL